MEIEQKGESSSSEPTGPASPPKEFLSKNIPAVLVSASALLIAIAVVMFFPWQVKPENITNRAIALYENKQTANPRELSEIADELARLGEKTTIPSKKAFILFLESSVLLSVDPSTSYGILRTIAATATYASTTRALAVQTIADRYMFGSRSQELATRYIFVDQPYVSFFTEAIDPKTNRMTKMRQGIRNLYQYSLSFADLPVPNYRLAEHFLALVEDSRITKKDQLSLIAEGEKYYKAGTAALPRFEQWMLFYFPTNIGYARWLEAKVAGQIALAQNNSAALMEAERKFKKTLELRENRLSALHRTWAAYEYARFLERAYGQKRSEDIISLLDAVLQSPRGVTPYLRVLATQTPTVDGSEMSFDKKHVEVLATMNPKFAEYLRELGWQF